MIPVIESQDLEGIWQAWADKVKQGLIEVPEDDGLEFSMAALLLEARHDTAD